MQVDELSAIDPNEDLTQILPIQQKRTIAFVNHFIMKTVSFVNKFAQSCESRLMEFEGKMQKLEATLLILESQLSSIPGLENVHLDKNNKTHENRLDTDVLSVTIEDTTVEAETVADNETENVDSNIVMAKDDPRFVKFFKMLQFGVPEPAVKLKMQNEGLDPNILNLMIIDRFKFSLLLFLIMSSDKGLWIDMISFMAFLLLFFFISHAVGIIYTISVFIGTFISFISMILMAQKQRKKDREDVGQDTNPRVRLW